MLRAHVGLQAGLLPILRLPGYQIPRSGRSVPEELPVEKKCEDVHRLRQ
jgi:hypothetical protein